jgi:hypothetical protein
LKLQSNCFRLAHRPQHHLRVGVGWGMNMGAYRPSRAFSVDSIASTIA